MTASALAACKAPNHACSSAPSLPRIHCTKENREQECGVPHEPSREQAARDGDASESEQDLPECHLHVIGRSAERARTCEEEFDPALYARRRGRTRQFDNRC
jgi:hypothetical protein